MFGSKKKGAKKKGGNHHGWRTGDLHRGGDKFRSFRILHNGNSNAKKLISALTGGGRSRPDQVKATGTASGKKGW